MPHKPHTRVETRFREAADALFADIRRLGNRFAQHERKIKNATIGQITEREEAGEHYIVNIMSYLDTLDTVKRNFSRRIDLTASKISQSIHQAKKDLPKRQAKKYRRDVWLAFASALQPLGSRPSKKFAAFLIDERERLVTWDVNHVCHGIEVFPDLLVKRADGSRGPHLWCAERNVIAKFLGISAVMPTSRDVSVIHAAIKQFSSSLIAAATHHPKLGKLSLVSSHYPCVPCAETIAPKDFTNGNHKKGRVGTIKELIAYWNETSEEGLVGPDRKTDLAPLIMRKGGVRENLKILRTCNCA